MIRNDLAGRPREPFRCTTTRALSPPSGGRARSPISDGRGSPAIPRGSRAALVHIFFLIGFRNRALVMIQWAWAYFTRQRGVRLITTPWTAHD